MEKKTGAGSVIIDGSGLTLSGVVKVLQNNGKQIIVTQGERTLTISGEDFNVTELNLDSGRFVATGAVKELKYSSKAEAGGLLKKLFK